MESVQLADSTAGNCGASGKKEAGCRILVVNAAAPVDTRPPYSDSSRQDQLKTGGGFRNTLKVTISIVR